MVGRSTKGKLSLLGSGPLALTPKKTTEGQWKLPNTTPCAQAMVALFFLEQFHENLNVLDILWIIWDCRNASCIPESLRHGFEAVADLMMCVFVGGCQQQTLGESTGSKLLSLGFACNHIHFIGNSCLEKEIYSTVRHPNDSVNLSSFLAFDVPVAGAVLCKYTSCRRPDSQRFLYRRSCPRLGSGWPQVVCNAKPLIRQVDRFWGFVCCPCQVSIIVSQYLICLWTLP